MHSIIDVERNEVKKELALKAYRKCSAQKSQMNISYKV